MSFRGNFCSSVIIHSDCGCFKNINKSNSHINSSGEMAPKRKKIKLSSPVSQELGSNVFSEDIAKSRLFTAASVVEFKFNKARVEILSDEVEMPEKNHGVLYWMSRDCRVQDNWAFLFAQKLALKVEVSLHACYCLNPDNLESSLRHLNFLFEGLKEVQKGCCDINIELHLFEGVAGVIIPKWVKENDIGAVVCDFSPLKTSLSQVDEVKKNLPQNVPFIRVDAHNLVPCKVVSDKMENNARTIRKKINSKLDKFLTEYPPLIKHPYSSDIKAKDVKWKKLLNKYCKDKSIGPCSWTVPGTESGLKMLETFCTTRLKNFMSKKKDLMCDAESNLSPWFRFGHISIQRAILSVKEYECKYSESVAAFCDEAIIRRELAENFCYYNKCYDSLKGASSWAQTTLNNHRNDEREFLYTRKQLENSLTHEDLWNCAQIQLVTEGKMHGTLRMYWAKKILEWTSSPEIALEDALYLNDKYSLDGRDSAGFVGCLCSIGGIHDQISFLEREVYGKIRYMNYSGCQRKYDIKPYVQKYGGKIHQQSDRK